MEGRGSGASSRRVAADLAEGHKGIPAIKRRVLHALGHDGTAGLLEAHDELVLASAPAEPAEREIVQGVELLNRVRGTCNRDQTCLVENVDRLVGTSSPGTTYVR